MFLSNEYKGKAEESVIAVMLNQWLYDSHLWEQVVGLKMRKCRWCGAESSLTAQVTKGERFCPKNPIIDQIINNAKAMFENQPKDARIFKKD